MLDYIVVGFGLSGLSFVEQLEINGKSFTVFENYSQKSSRVAGGLFNPVILKRFTAAWQASEQIKIAIPFYKTIENKLKESLVFDLPVLRRFNDIEEQNRWFEACDKPILNEFLSPELIKNVTPGINAPYHFGKVKHTGRIDIKSMLESYLHYLDQKNCVITELFEHDEVMIKDGYIEYKGIQAKKILFSEGYGLKNNPFFNYLPLIGNKGEYIIIKSKALKLQKAIKSSIFIIPLGEDLYKVGATYNNQDKSPNTTEAAREEIQKKLERFLETKYNLVDQVAGVRPTVRDRKPLVGVHPEYENVYVLNGLGSRGILIGPSVAKNLYQNIEKGIPLDKEVDIKRFDTLR